MFVSSLFLSVTYTRFYYCVPIICFDFSLALQVLGLCTAQWFSIFCVELCPNINWIFSERSTVYELSEKSAYLSGIPPVVCSALSWGLLKCVAFCHICACLLIVISDISLFSAVWFGHLQFRHCLSSFPNFGSAWSSSVIFLSFCNESNWMSSRSIACLSVICFPQPLHVVVFLVILVNPLSMKVSFILQHSAAGKCFRG